MNARAVRVVLHALLLGGCAAGGPKTCKVDRVVDLPLIPGLAVPAVEARLDGQKVVVLIDTGASTSIINSKAAERFNLRPGSESNRIALEGVGGSVFAPVVTVSNLMLGRGIARDLELPVAGDLGDTIQGMPVLGLFGADFLSNYDVDLDAPGHHFAMYRLVACGSAMQPLDDPAFSVPFSVQDTRIMLDVRLNGKPVTAVLDTGASITLISQVTALEAGVAQASLGADAVQHVHGIDENGLATQVHRFASLQVGAETMKNFHFAVARSDAADMLLGNEFLRYNHVWISYPLGRLYVHPVIPAALGHP